VKAAFATPDDAPALAALHARAFDAPWSAEAFAELLGGPGVVGLMTEHGIALIRTVAGEAELLTIGVAPEARGCGTGRALLNAAMEVAALAGAEVVHLEVAADNVAALALYAGAQFERAGLRRGYYARRQGPAEDAVLLRRALNTPAA
jgi:ribosomal-protein-alanine N-acetyltransferase